jgi:hypothetical protein
MVAVKISLVFFLAVLACVFAQGASPEASTGATTSSEPSASTSSEPSAATSSEPSAASGGSDSSGGGYSGGDYKGGYSGGDYKGGYSGGDYKGGYGGYKKCFLKYQVRLILARHRGALPSFTRYCGTCMAALCCRFVESIRRIRCAWMND